MITSAYGTRTGTNCRSAVMAVADEIAAAADPREGQAARTPRRRGTRARASTLQNRLLLHGSCFAIPPATCSATAVGRLCWPQRWQPRASSIASRSWWRSMARNGLSQLLAGANLGEEAADLLRAIMSVDLRAGGPQRGRDRLATPSDGSVGANQVAKAKSDDKAAPNGDASTKGPSSAQSRRDRLASLETARKKEQRTPHHPTIGDLPGIGDRAVGLSGLSLRR